DRSLLGAERMVQRDDGRGLGQPVALDDHEPELAPERLERRIERRRADDEGPELHPERAVDAAIAPPAQGEMFFSLATLKGSPHIGRGFGPRDIRLLWGGPFRAAVTPRYVILQHI